MAALALPAAAINPQPRAAAPARPCPCPFSLLAALDETQERIKEIEGEMRRVLGEMQGLKTELYAKFGSSINLEE